MRFLKLTRLAFSFFAVTSGSVLAQAPANDLCSGAINIGAAFGQPIGAVISMGPYDNTDATHHPTDPANGYDCFGEPEGSGSAPTLDNTLWFSFTGDGNLYFIETGMCNPALSSSDYITDGDTQIAIYTGSCGSLVPVFCNEDGPGATSSMYPAGLSFRPDSGVTYYLMVDGFAFNGVVSKGKFCLEISRMPDVACYDGTVSAGTATATANQICPGQMVSITANGVGTPNVGEYSGASWLVTTHDLQGSYSNLIAQNIVTTYTISNPAPATLVLNFENDGTYIGSPATGVPYGTYYWTPVVFGNAVNGTPGTSPIYLGDLYLDAACTILGNSVQVEISDASDAPCQLIGITELTDNTFSINNVYPVPVLDDLTIDVKAAGNTIITVVVKDMLGRVVATHNKAAVAGSNAFTVEMNNQPAGVYFVTATDGNHTAVSKLVKE